MTSEERLLELLTEAYNILSSYDDRTEGEQEWIDEVAPLIPAEATIYTAPLPEPYQRKHDAKTARTRP